MAIDTTLIGTTAAELMELIPDESEGEIIEVGIVVVIDDGEGTYTRTKCSTELHYRQVGLFSVALDVVRGDTEPEEDEDEIEGDENR